MIEEFSDSDKIDPKLRDKLLDLALDEVSDNRHLLCLDTKPFVERSRYTNEPLPQIAATGRSRNHFSGQMGKIAARNLRYEVTDEDLKSLFGAFGPLKRAAINYDSDGRPAGTAFIVFECKSDAMKAFRSLDGKQLDGRRLLLRIIDRQPSGLPFSGRNQRADQKPSDNRKVDINKENITPHYRDLDLDLEDYTRQRKRAKTGNS